MAALTAMAYSRLCGAYAAVPPCDQLFGPSGAAAARAQTAAPGAPIPFTADARLTLDSTTTWQPAGGEVRFTLAGAAIDPTKLNVTVCFRWHGTAQTPDFTWHGTPTPLHVIGEPSANAVTLGVIMPQELTDEGFYWLTSLSNQQRPDNKHVAGTGFWLVPLAEMAVAVVPQDGSAGTIQFRQQVGISSHWLSFIPALLILLAAWWIFFRWAKLHCIKGGCLLAVISDSEGYASLSQFQMILWTFVTGLSVLYVMTLSGSLINIPQSALWLMGISGAAVLSASLADNQANKAPALLPPGAVTGLSTSGAATANSVTLTWTPVAGSGAPLAYTVQFRPASTLPWSVAAANAAGPPYAVTWLQPNTAYEFQVFAVNAQGAGPASSILSAATAGDNVPLPGTPAPPAGLQVAPGIPPASAISVSWAATADAPAYLVQYRAEGQYGWATVPGAGGPPRTITGLEGGTRYEVQVFAVNNGILSAPSQPASCVTARRTPKWSDLIIAASGKPEIDVSRVQMLLFTAIAAVFVTMKVFDINQIPDIPATLLTLMGISNGVYIGAKLIPRSG